MGKLLCILQYTSTHIYTDSLNFFPSPAHILIDRLPSLTPGISNDMERASQIATSMVTDFAMFPEVLPYSIKRNQLISQELRTKIDEKVKGIISQRLQVVKGVLTEQVPSLLVLSDALMRKETLSFEEVEVLLREDFV